MKTILKIFLLATILLFTVSCEKETFGDSIFIDEDPKAQSAFDKWLNANYLVPYNLAFLYKMQDVGAPTDYNLVPTRLEKSKEMAILVKYLWFDVYGEVVNEDFLKDYGPRIIHLIGSSAYNTNGTRLLGTAEGGIKVTLFDCNSLQTDGLLFNNEYYFKTMHHEFAHILHQKKSYPKEYETLSAGHYDPMYWQERSDNMPSESEIRNHSQYAPLGFVTAYGSSQPREDFVEVIANFITKSDVWWTELLRQAAIPGPNGESIKGHEIIEKKIEMCKKWLWEEWDIDLVKLRDNVRARQLLINEALQRGFEEIESYEED
jgi:hypothetical protein